jgi:hypothetical protein
MNTNENVCEASYAHGFLKITIRRGGAVVEQKVIALKSRPPEAEVQKWINEWCQSKGIPVTNLRGT